MFVNKLQKENQSLLDFSFDMHKKGMILPDTYVLDVDQIIQNGKSIIKECNRDVKAYFMLKQLGRNPYIAKKLMEIGFEGAVAVDYKDCRVLMEHNIPIKHAGHLTQIPTHFLPKLLQYGVEYITVYSLEKAKEINEIAKKLGINQQVFLKTYTSKEDMYMGQFSGFTPDEIVEIGTQIQTLSNVEVSGLTTFPAFLYNEDQKDIMETNNMEAVHQAKQLLEQAGLTIKELNLPSSNCAYNVSLVKKNQGTIIEPGHALTGTTMMHSCHDLPEKIAYMYLTEVSHNFKGNSSVYGGGYYPRGHVEKAIVNQEVANVLPFAAESIDYYLQLDKEYTVGTSVAMCFRTQMFWTRSDIVLVEGISSSNPIIVGTYTSQGQRK